eukprot:365778-Chlamydomonas_euryale.AAC.13
MTRGCWQAVQWYDAESGDVEEFCMVMCSWTDLWSIHYLMECLMCLVGWRLVAFMDRAVIAMSTMLPCLAGCAGVGLGGAERWRIKTVARAL